MPTTGSQLLAPDGPVAALLPGYEARPAQLEMAAAMDVLLDRDDGRLLVEAGTGIGKSLAYLAPAMARAACTVVATGTKALQDQLARDDAPLVSRALVELGGSPPNVVVVKGRGNYVCHLRLERMTTQQQLPELDPHGHVARVEQWLETTQTGDRSELGDMSDDLPLWPEIDAGAETCVGSSCPHRDRCFIVRLRERARRADLIVTNHHLLMADEALRLMQRFGEIPDSAELLPPHELLVVDEAHALQAVATEAFSAALSTGQLERLGRDIRRSGAELIAPQRRALEEWLLAAEQSGRSVLHAMAPPPGSERAAVEPDPKVGAAGEQAATAFARLTSHLEQLASEAPTCRALAQRTHRFGRALEFVAAAQDSAYVYFSERRKKAVRVVAAPIEVARPLAETLFRSGRAVTLTSATLCTDKGFESTRRALGLEAGDVEELQLASPYPYAELVRIYLPAEPIIPDSADHLDRLAAEMEGLCRAAGGGCFLLFTSYRVLGQIHDRLAPRLPLRSLRQGEAPRHTLLERFREDGDAVLFGTHSFWQGVDVRGPALRLVAIDRLPFASPGDPLFAARSRLLEERGERPFTALALPQAILELKQGAGRLVRSSTDRGVIALLDGRAQKRGYGRRFLTALPPAPRIQTLEEVEAFYRTEFSP